MRSVYDLFVPPETPFISYAQNREDVVLWRALGHLPAGRYVEVGGNHSRTGSVSRAFYNRGWSGITVTPMHELSEGRRAERPRDTMVEAEITEGSSLTEVLMQHIGIDKVVHFMLVDTQGSAAQVLSSVDFLEFRPWVLVIESTAPGSTVQTQDAWESEVVAAGYRFCLFDGLSRFYVAEEHAETLQARLAYPACVLDAFVEASTNAAAQGRLELVEEVRRWRAEALAWWATTGEPAAVLDLRGVQEQLTATVSELFAMQSTLSWKITRPLRALRLRIGRP